MSISRRGLIGALGATAVTATVTGPATSAAAAPGGPATGAAARSRARRREGTLRVATFNIHYGAGRDAVLDLDHTIEVIEAIDADVIALQEVDRHFRPRSNWADQPTLLAQALQLEYAYGANIDLDPLEPGEPRRQYGCAFLSRWPILSSRNTHLPLYPDSERRGLLEIVANVDGRRLRFANTHMQNTRNDEWLDQARTIVNLLAGSAEPVILLGDTNSMPNAAGMRTFTDRYDDVWARVGVGEGLTTPPYRLDYIFVPKTADVRHAWLVCTDASDHLPLVTDVILA